MKFVSWTMAVVLLGSVLNAGAAEGQVPVGIKMESLVLPTLEYRNALLMRQLIHVHVFNCIRVVKHCM